MRGGSPILLTALLAAWLASPALADDVVVHLTTPGDAFVVKNNTGAIERLRVDEDTGNISRDGSLFLHTTGSDNTFVGATAGALVSSGEGNAAFGSAALYNNTTGIANSAFGTAALFGNSAASGTSNNSAFGMAALFSNRAEGNSAFGARALDANTYGTKNAAFGFHALGSNATGDRNSAFGYMSLYSNTGMDNTAFGSESLYSNTGMANAAFGSESLYSNTTGGANTAFGSKSLYSNTLFDGNAAFGYKSLYSNTGMANAAFGYQSLYSNTGGAYNAAFGSESLYSITGGGWNYNAAFGCKSLYSLGSGDRNTAVGYQAGLSLTSGSDNIYIGNAGNSTESGQIRIGNSAAHTDAFIAGIYGNTVTGSTVFVSSGGELGVGTSSIRFKQAVRDMDDASRVLMKMRPVTFQYREEVAGGEDLLQYGLIAEEVAEVEPGLVTYDEEGKPFAVRYQFLAPMLVNEYQKQQRTIESQAAVIDQLTARLERLEAEVGRAAR